MSVAKSATKIEKLLHYANQAGIEWLLLPGIILFVMRGIRCGKLPDQYANDCSNIELPGNCDQCRQ